MVMTFAAAFSCRFFEISWSGYPRSIGLWTVEAGFSDSSFFEDDWYIDYCQGWNYYNQDLSSDYFDAAMKAARAFGMMSSILSVFAFILIMIPACVSFGNHNTYLNSIAALLVVLGVFTILDLVSEYI
jgi:lipopolysaccharide export LptBFGC system permease protein LptF